MIFVPPLCYRCQHPWSSLHWSLSLPFGNWEDPGPGLSCTPFPCLYPGRQVWPSHWPLCLPPHTLSSTSAPVGTPAPLLGAGRGEEAEVERWEGVRMALLVSLGNVSLAPKKVCENQIPILNARNSGFIFFSFFFQWMHFWFLQSKVLQFKHVHVPLWLSVAPPLQALF